MAKKLSALEAQKMKFTQCMTVCAVDAVKEEYRKGRWLLLILAVIIGIGYFWDEIAWGAVAAFSAIWSFLTYMNISDGIHWLASGWHTVFIESVRSIYGGVNGATEWASFFMHTGRTCEMVGEGDASHIVCAMDGSPVNFISLSVSGAFAIVINSVWFMPFTVLVGMIFTGWSKWFTKSEWKEMWVEQWGFYKIAVPFVAVGWLIASILAGIMGHFTLEFFLVALQDKSVAAAALIIIPLLFTGVPLLILISMLDKGERSLKWDLENKARKAYESEQITFDKFQELKTRISSMSENIKIWVPRILLFSLAGCLYLAAAYYGTMLVPDGWGFAGFIGSSLAVIALLYPMLAGTVTCYVDLRKQVSTIEKEIEVTEEAK